MNSSNPNTQYALSEEEIEALIAVRTQSPCLLPDRWLEVICDGGEFSDQERQHVSTCQHCQRSQARWLIAKKTKIVEDGPKASQWASLSDLTDQDIRDWVGQELPISMHGVIQTGAFLLGGTRQSISFRLLTPVGTMLRDERPVFRWGPLSSAVSYRIEVRAIDATGVPDNLMAEASGVVPTSWQSPDPLPRGQMLQWWVFASDSLQEIGLAPKPDDSSAIFRILTKGELEELETAESRVHASSIERALLLLGFGLVDEATEQFKSIEDANPTSSDGQLAAVWRSRLQVIRGTSE